jgi:hypothetical protein
VCTEGVVVDDNNIPLFQKLSSDDPILMDRDVNTFGQNGRVLLHSAVEAESVLFLGWILNHHLFGVFAREEIGKSISPLTTTTIAINKVIAGKVKRQCTVFVFRFPNDLKVTKSTYAFRRE